MAQEQLDVLLKLKDEMSAAVAKAEAGLKGLQTATEKASGAAGSGGLSFGKLATAIGVGNLAADAARGVIGSLTGFLQGTIAAAQEAQAGQAQLAAVLTSTAGAAGVSAAAANELAQQLAATTTYTDDQALSMESLLLTFTNVGKDVFPDAAKAIVDVSTAMGQDLKSSTIQLGKALNDPIQGITALTRVGVNFSDEQQNMIKNLVETGRGMEAQKIILAELSKEFGGSAAAAAETYEGKMTRVKNALGEVQENIGKAVLPALGQFVDGALESAKGAQKASGNTEQWARALYAFLAPVKAVGLGLEALALAVGGMVVEFASKIKSGVQILGILGDSINKLIHGDFAGAKDAFMSIGDVAHGVSSSAQKLFSEAGAKLKEAMKSAAEGVKQEGFKPIEDAAMGASGKVAGAAFSMGNAATKAADKFKAAAQSFADMAEGVSQKLYDTTKDYISRAQSLLDGYQSKVADINKSIADENASFDKDSLKAKEDYTSQVVDLFIKEQDKLADLKAQYEEADAKIRESGGTPELNKKRDEALAGQTAVQKEINAIKAQQVGVEQMAADQRAKSEIDKLKEAYDSETKARDEQHASRIADLTAKMEEEKALYEKQKAELVADTIDKYEKIGAELNKGWTKMQEDTKGHVEAMKALEQQVMAIKASITAATAAVNAGVAPTVTKPVPKAAGGPVVEGRPYIVGEAGPELFVPSSSGAIQPNGSKAMEVRIMEGANVSVRSDADIRSIADQVAQALARTLQSQRNGLAT